jgi:hypothetical protein
VSEENRVAASNRQAGQGASGGPRRPLSTPSAVYSARLARDNVTVMCGRLAPLSSCGGHLGRLFVLVDDTPTLEVEPGMVECRRGDGRWYQPRRFARTASERKLRQRGIPAGIGDRPIEASDAKRQSLASGRLRARIAAEQSLAGARLSPNPPPAVRGDKDPIVYIECPRCGRLNRADLLRLQMTEGARPHRL